MELLNTIATNRIWTRHGVKIAYGLSGVFLFMSAISVALNIRAQSHIKKVNYSKQSIAPISKKPKHLYQVNDIIRANLFGDPNPKIIAKKAPKTTLDLTLQGLLSASNTGLARAIIRSGKRNSRLYSIGETVEGAGVSIENIKTNEVLLNRNGAIESLPLKQVKTSGNNSIISYSNYTAGQDAQPPFPTSSASTPEIRRSSPKPRSQSGRPRRIKKPNFSGLDRALKKMGEI